MLERSESATIPMREKTGEKKANFHKRAYQLTPTSSLKDVEEGKEGPSDLLQKTSHYFSKRKISEEQISCKNSESSKQSKISVQEEEDILSQPQGHQEKLFSSQSEFQFENSTENLVSPLIARKTNIQSSDIQMHATPQQLNHRQLHERQEANNFQKKDIADLGDSVIFSPESRQIKNQSDFLRYPVKDCLRRGSHLTQFGKKTVSNCVLCCNSLHPIFEQLREKEEENLAFR